MLLQMQAINEQFIQHVTIDNIDEAKMLLDVGANVHYCDNYALKICAANGFLKLMKILVEYGADIHVFDDYPLRKSVANDHEDVAKYLIGKKANVNAMDNFALRMAALNGNLIIVKMLFTAGADVHDGEVLKNAIQNEHVDVVKLLLEYGVKIPSNYEDIKNKSIRKLFEYKMINDLVKANNKLVEENSVLKEQLESVRRIIYI